MLASVGPRALRMTAVVGERRMRQFTELAALHRDGWGTAWIADNELRGETSVRSRVSTDAFDPTAANADEPTRARMLYLRFASGTSARSAENVQPFFHDGMAFQHNGAMSPVAEARSLLRPELASTLRGTSDSELYFALVRQHLVDPTVVGVVASMSRAAMELRHVFPHACLNALLLTELALIVVQSSADAAVPVAAFAARGFDAHALPRGHDESYNRLAWTRDPASGTFIVATSGIDTEGWTPVSQHTVSWFPIDGSLPGSKSLRTTRWGRPL